MEKLEKLIDCIKSIDKSLDAYEYNGYTYDEYISCIKNKEKGLNSIRNSPKKIWTVWMDESLNKAKNIYNKICSDNITEEDIKQIKNLIERFNNSAKSFYTDTDKLSLYPIESELIYNNLKTISNIFKFYYEEFDK